MIDDIIKKLLALPKLIFSAAANQEFLNRTNRIAANSIPLNGKTFRDDLLFYPNTILSSYDLRAIEIYFAYWRDMTIELESFSSLMKHAWLDTHKKQIDADSQLPFLICMMSKDPLILQRLHQVLEYARDVDQSHYLLNALYASATFLLDEVNGKNNYITTEADLRVEEKVNAVLSKLRDSDYYFKLYLMLRLDGVCIIRMNDCFSQIYGELALHDIHDYDFNYNELDKEERRHTANGKIMEMFANINNHPFTSYPELGKDVKKYIAYLEFHISLSRTSANIFDRLRETIYKFPVFENLLSNDLDEISINLTEETRTYLGIPDDKKSSLFTLFGPATNDNMIPFKRFFQFFVRKMQQLENIDDTKEKAAAATPAIMHV